MRDRVAGPARVLRTLEHPGVEMLGWPPHRFGHEKHVQERRPSASLDKIRRGDVGGAGRPDHLVEQVLRYSGLTF
jgi:hypothetical protein